MDLLAPHAHGREVPVLVRVEEHAGFGRNGGRGGEVQEKRGEVQAVVLPVAGEAEAGERGEGGEDVEGGGERGGDA